MSTPQGSYWDLLVKLWELIKAFFAIRKKKVEETIAEREKDNTEVKEKLHDELALTDQSYEEWLDEQRKKKGNAEAVARDFDDLNK